MANAVSTWILKQLSRRTASGAFVPELDGLRFVAIFWVVLYHIELLHQPEVPAGLQVASGAGHYGVELFFIISGFVLALPFATWRMQAGRPVQLRRYYLRRLTRLEPPYLLSLLVFFALKVALKGQSAHELLPNLLASAGYVHNVIYAQRSAVSVVAWSLEIEVQFYLLAPLLGRVFLLRDARVRRGILCAGIAGAMLLCAVFDRDANPRLFLSLPAYVQYFLIGFLLSDFYLTGDWRTDHGRRPSFDVVGLAALGLLGPVVCFGYHQWWGQLTAPLLTGLFCVGAFHGPLLNRFFRNPWVYSYGGICYTIYLYHSILVQGAGATAKRVLGSGVTWPRMLADIGLSVGIVVVVCPVLFVLTERYFMTPDWHLELRGRLSRLLGLRPTSPEAPRRR